MILMHLPSPSHPVAIFPLSAIVSKSQLMQQLEPAFTWFDNAIKNTDPLAISTTVLVASPETTEKEMKPPHPRSPRLLDTLE